MMLISSVDGLGFRYEVMARSDGYLVQVRDRASDALICDDERLFRTASAAFAYVDYAAALDIAASGQTTNDNSAIDELSETRDHFSQLSRELSDNGVCHVFLAAWEGSSARQQRRMYH
jgi:hypothetical protein